jgi:cytochrome d ubiquinol oxidase subunit I
MEFQFGTNWSQFSKSAGGVIGQTLAMEGVFSFFLESSFLGLFLLGEKRLGPRLHWLSSMMMFPGSWLSGYLIMLTDAWMQHPVGYHLAQNGSYELNSFWALLLNPWGLWQYAHTMVGACFLLSKQHEKFGQILVRVGVTVGMIAALLQLFPTGDGQGKMMAQYQRPTLAAMEALFQTRAGAPIAILGQPDVPKQRLDNPLTIPSALSFLTYQKWTATVQGLDQFPQSDWPDNIALL